MRDNFSQEVKRSLADRVAWKCCFPGCKEVTIGPGNRDDKHVIKLGVAAHITAASPGGPRYNNDLNSGERSSISNAIWLCTKHGELIDRDFYEYSAETLRQWKAQAEEQAHKNLIAIDSEDNYLTTLISIGPLLICEAKWKSINANLWSFTVGKFIKGNRDNIFEYSMNFNSISVFNKYLIFERQGDGRMLDSILLSDGENGLEVCFSVKDKFPCQDPNQVGEDIALDEDGDLAFLDDDFKVVTGIEAAKQAISSTLSTSPGELKFSPLAGSYFSEYYKKHKDDLLTLERLLKVEITRLLSIPIKDEFLPSLVPQLPFIKRILSVKILESTPNKSRIPILLKGEWGNGEIFEEIFKIFILE